MLTVLSGDSSAAQEARMRKFVGGTVSNDGLALHALLADQVVPGFFQDGVHSER